MIKIVEDIHEVGEGGIIEVVKVGKMVTWAEEHCNQEKRWYVKMAGLSFMQD